MAAPPHDINNDPLQWTVETVIAALKVEHPSPLFLRNAMRWSEETYKTASALALQGLAKHKIDLAPGGRLPPRPAKDTKSTRAADEYQERIAIEIELANEHVDIFGPSHLVVAHDYPPWVPPGFTRQDRQQRKKDEFDYEYETVVQRFIALVHGRMKSKIRHVKQIQKRPYEQPSSAFGDVTRPELDRHGLDSRTQSPASTTAMGEPRLKKGRLSTPTTVDAEGDVAMFDQRMSRTPAMKDLVLYVVHVHVSKPYQGSSGLERELELETAIVDAGYALGTSGKFDAAEFKYILDLAPGEHAFVYRGTSDEDLWKVDLTKGHIISASLKQLRNLMDTTAHPSAVLLFLALDRDHLLLLPEEWRVLSQHWPQNQLLTVSLNEGEKSAEDIVDTKRYGDGEDHEGEQNLPIEIDEGVREDFPPHLDYYDETKESQHRDEGGENRGLVCIEDTIMVDANALQDNQENFPWMIRIKTEEASQQNAPVSQTPSVPLPSYCNARFVGWMSSNLPFESESNDVNAAEEKDEDAEDGLVEANEYLHNRIRSTHIDPEEWLKTCAFFGFDKNKSGTAWGAWFEGWAKERGLAPYQLLTVAFTLARVCSKERVTIIGHGMGLGKTAIALAIIVVLTRTVLGTKDEALLVSPFGPLVDPVNTRALDQDAGSDPYFNLGHLLGFKPVLRKGPTIVIMPTDLIRQWSVEAKKFLVGPQRPIFVVVHNKTVSSKKKEEIRNDGAYHFTDSISLADIPDGCYDAFSQRKQKEYTNNGKIPIRDLLYPKLLPASSPEVDQHGRPVLGNWWDGEAYVWQSQFVILTTRATSSTLIPRRGPFRTFQRRYQRAKSEDEDMLKFIPSLVIVDEAHQSNKPHASPFGPIQNMPGGPPVVVLSATPYYRLTDLSALLISSFALYLKYIKQATMQTITSANYVVGETVTYHDSLSAVQRKQIKKTSWLQMHTRAHTVDKILDTQTLKSKSGESTEVTTINPRNIDGNTNAAIEVFRDWITDMQIGMEADTYWTPLPEFEKQPIINFPPHSSFDLHYAVDEEFAKGLDLHWAKRLANNGSGGWMSSYSEFQVLLRFPSLLKYMEADEELRKECGRFTKAKALAIGKAGSESKLWSYIPQLCKQKTLSMLYGALRDMKLQKNGLGFPRKVALIAWRPFLQLIIVMAMIYWGESPEFDAVDGKADCAIASSFSNKSRVLASIKAFQTTMYLAEGYNPKPGFLLGSGYIFSAGHNLVPANAIILLDSNWKATDEIQTAGRVRRNGLVQTSSFTESFRFVPSSEKCKLAEWLCDRHMTQDAIMKMIQKETARVQEGVRGAAQNG